ncbi:type IV pilus biogenesis/stability protein PilW [Streptomyces roseifaciens]
MLLSLNTFLLFLAMALVVLTVMGAVHRVFGSRPVEEIIVPALALVLVLASMRRFQAVRIMPFRNLVKGDSNEPIDQMAAGFAELLNAEIRRVADLMTTEPFHQPADVLNPASTRGETARRSPSREAFKSGLPASGLSADMRATEVGTIALGPFRLQVGPVLTLLARMLGRALQGSLVEADGVITAVATQSGPRRRTWTARTVVEDGDLRQASARLARDLAHRIELERPGASASGACPHSFPMVVDGLECYQRFMHEGSLHELDLAELHFRRAVVHSPRYAAAYHNLGMVKVERDRVRRQLRLPVSKAHGAEANLWRQAIELDPTPAPARFQLTRCALARVDDNDESTDGDTALSDTERRSLLEQALQSAEEAMARPSGVHPMERTLAEYWLGMALLRHGRHLRNVREIRAADVHLSRVEADLSDERARRLVLEGDETAVQPLTERVAWVKAERAECRLARAELVRPPRSSPSRPTRIRMTPNPGWSSRCT